MKKILKTLLILILAAFTWNIIIGTSIVFRPFFEKTEDVPSFEKNRVIVQATEGKAHITTDRNGLNNSDLIYDDGEKDLSVIVLGDSHTESLQVARQDNFPSLLMVEMNKTNDGVKVFNLGISGLSLADYIKFSNIYNEKYQPDMLVVQVTESDFFADATSLSKLVSITEENGEYVIKTKGNYEGGLQTLLTKIYTPLNDILRAAAFLPFLEYTKMKAEQLFRRTSTVAHNGKHSEQYDLELLDWELKTLKENYSMPIIFVYLPTTPIIEGQQVLEKTSSFVEILTAYSQKYDITVVNMEKAFNEHYKKTKRLPRGFDNTSMGTGHLNETGHMLVARELSKAVQTKLEKVEENAL